MLAVRLASLAFGSMLMVGCLDKPPGLPPPQNELVLVEPEARTASAP